MNHGKAPGPARAVSRRNAREERFLEGRGIRGFQRVLNAS